MFSKPDKYALSDEQWELVLYYAKLGIEGCSYCDPDAHPIARGAVRKFEEWLLRQRYRK
jgi:hypothetical protein